MADLDVDGCTSAHTGSAVLNPHSNSTASQEMSQTGNSNASTIQISKSVVKAIFLLLGVGILIPWNAFVSAKPYFQARFCSDEGNDIVDFERWFGLIWNSASVVSLGLIIVAEMVKDQFFKERHSNLNPLSQEASSTPLNPGNESDQRRGRSAGHSFWLVMVPLALYMAVFVATDLLVLVIDIPPSTFLAITFVGLAMCGTCGAIATAGIVSTAGLFDSSIGINPFFSGQALGGVVVSSANFVAASLEDPSSFFEQRCQGDNYRKLDGEPTCSPYSQHDWAVFAYFLGGCGILFCCLVGYSYISKYQRSEHRDDYEPVQDNNSEVDEQSPRIGLEMNERVQERAASESLDTFQDEDNSTDQQNTEDPPSHSANEPVDLEEYIEEESEAAVFSAIKGPASCIFLTFTVTLCLFPSWISQLRSTHECESHFRLTNDLYVPFSFVVFNLGDLAGRLCSEKVPVERIRHMSLKLVIASVCRVAFFPLLLFCASEVSGLHPMTIESDFYSLVVQFLFAFTNGILISCSFMHAPHLVAHTTGMQERASEMMSFAVFFGLLSGSLLSFPFSKFISKL